MLSSRWFSNVKRYFFYILLFWVTYHSNGWGQVFPIRTYSTKNGLLSNIINCLYQDSKGFLWIGTEEGLNRYDGRTFTNYSTANGLPFNAVNDIIEDRASPGALWIARQSGGLAYMKNDTFTNYLLETSNAPAVVFRIVQDKRNRIWCATGNGVYIFDKDKGSRKFRGDIHFSTLADIALEGDSVLWASEIDMLHRISIVDRRHTVFALPGDSNILPYNSPLYLGKDNNVWVGLTDGSVALCENGKITHRKNFGMSSITHIVEDSKGTMWVSTFSGVMRLPKEKFFTSVPSVIGKDNGLLESATKYTLIDRESNYWFVSATRGLSKLSERQLVIFPLSGIPKTPNNRVGTVDQSNRIWACSYTGLFEFWKTSTGDWKEFHHSLNFEHIEPAHYPISISFDSKNRCCLLFSDGIFSLYDVTRLPESPSSLKKIKNFDPRKRYGSGIPFFFILDDRDRIWYADANYGVYVFDTDISESLLRLITPKDGLPNIAIRSLYQDRSGNMWFGGNSEGLARLSLSKFLTDTLTTYTTKDGLVSNAIRSLFQDRNGKLWIGTRFEGLSIFHHGKFTSLDVRHGLLSNTIWRIAQDSSQRLWFGTPTGVMFIDNIDAREFRKYERELLASQVVSLGATRTGEMWCLSDETMTIFDPTPKKQESISPPIYITHCSVNGNSLSLSGPLQFSHDENNVVIEYIGIGFKDEDEITYEYRLLGADKQWQPPRKENSISYGALQPGSYTFEVRAINSDGIKSAVPATLKFSIASPFWKAWWFILSVNIFVIGLFALGYQYRVRQLLKIERLRTRISSDLHDEIASNLSSIAMFSKIIEDESHPASALQPHHQSLLKRISILSQESVQSIRDIIWAIDPKTETLESLISRLGDSAFSLCRAKNIQLDFQLPKPEELPAHDLAPEVRKNLWLIAKEALNNSIKHSDCSAIAIRYTLDYPMFTLVIQDNGKGIDEKKSSKGKGLATMRMRAKQLRGKLEIGKNEKGGTSVTAVVNLK
ncbi:MAG: hypothetical protein EPO24_08745 [Bacteroidetes bacterium]|nr:MAG: hypothetical protein EPO24_08745 [Bacteroidota bacterium]